jgi:hypothetical protein
MPKLIAAIAAAVLFSTSAFANVITVKFEPTTGDAVSFAFDTEANTSTNLATGEAGPYTFDEAANKLCGSGPDGAEVCVTFDGPAGEPTAGQSGPYSTNTGTSGTATIVSIE